MQHCPQWQTMVELEIMHRIHNSLTVIIAQCTKITAQCTMQVAQHNTIQNWVVNRNCKQCSQIISQTLVKKWQIWSTLVWIEYSQLQWVWSAPHAAFSEKDANGPLGQPTPRISVNPKHFLDNFKLNDKIHLNTVTIDWIQASSLQSWFSTFINGWWTVQVSLSQPLNPTSQSPPLWSLLPPFSVFFLPPTTPLSCSSLLAPIPSLLLGLLPPLLPPRHQVVTEN